MKLDIFYLILILILLIVMILGSTTEGLFQQGGAYQRYLASTWIRELFK